MAMAAVFWLTCCYLAFSLVLQASGTHGSFRGDTDTTDENQLPKGDLLTLLVNRAAAADPCILPVRLRPPSCMRQYGRYYKRMPLDRSKYGPLRQAADRNYPMW